MKLKTARKILATSLVAAALVGMSATSAMAATQSNGSDGPVYLLDPGTAKYFSATDEHDFYYDVVAAPDPTDFMKTFQCSPDATNTQNFIAPVGSERDRDAWIAWSDGGFVPNSNKEVLLYAMTLSSNNLGDPSAVETKGGKYSAGMACLIDNNVNFAKSGIWYSTINVTPGTGAWTAEDTKDAVVGEPVIPQTADIAITAQTIAAAEGVLSLNVTAGASATIGNPTLVNGVSTSTGKLGEFSVTDGRVTGKKGWNLTTTVADFVGADATNTIPAAQLGVAPKIVTSTTAGSTASAAQIAGSAKFPANFAAVPLGTTVAETVLDADLTFIAPADKAAGTYTSKMTLTLTSN
jgi:hypothetical protein